jgi:molybdopterin-guanine dinucleotide biosynthesis protein A
MADDGESSVRAAILAGGRAARLGGAKPAADLAGRPLISYPLEAARAADLDPFVLAKSDSPLPPLDCDVVREPDLPVHPLLGIISALEAADGPVIALGCDMPFLTPPLLSWLAQREPPAVSRVAGRLEPLLAIYAPDGAEVLRGVLGQEAPLRAAVEELGPQLIPETDLERFGEPERLVMSVNTEADLAAATRLLAT